jgi:hypothetical protein
MMASVVELLVALLFIFTAGHILIRLLDNYRESHGRGK